MLEQNLQMIQEMLLDAPLNLNTTTSNIMGQMLLIQALMVDLCINNHTYDIICRASSFINELVASSLREYKSTVNFTKNWGTAFWNCIIFLQK